MSEPRTGFWVGQLMKVANDYGHDTDSLAAAREFQRIVRGIRATEPPHQHGAFEAVHGCQLCRDRAPLTRERLAAALRASHQATHNHGNCTWSSDHLEQADGILTELRLADIRALTPTRVAITDTTTQESPVDATDVARDRLATPTSAPEPGS